MEVTMVDRQELLNDAIARRAYEIYIQRGGEDGKDVEDWIRAEQEHSPKPVADRQALTHSDEANLRRESPLARSAILLAPARARSDSRAVSTAFFMWPFFCPSGSAL
jgi:hypothetical protein